MQEMKILNEYRYLDLRRPAMYRNFVVRDAVCRSVHEYLHRH